MNNFLVSLSILLSCVAMPVYARPGALDLTFNLDSSLDSMWIECVALQPDGKILVGGDSVKVARLYPDGSLDPTFTPPDTSLEGLRNVYCMVLQPDGKVLLGGYGGVGRLLSDGTRDLSFKAAVQSDPDYPSILSIVVQPDGRLLLGGEFEGINGVSRRGIARLNADGSLDESFDPGTGVSRTNGFIQVIATQRNGRILIGGQFTEYNGQPRSDLTRLNSDGTLDSSFDPKLSFMGVYGVKAVVLQPDGKVLVGGSFSAVNSLRTPRSGLARLNANGSLDSTFGAKWLAFVDKPYLVNPYMVSSLILQPDGKVVVAGCFGGVQDMLSPTLKYWSRNGVARFNSDGTLDSSFDPGNGIPFACEFASGVYVGPLVMQEDGRLLIGGHFDTFDGTSRNNLARLLGDRPPEQISIYPASNSFECAGGTGSVFVSAPAGYNWTASPNANWISISSGASGQGRGEVGYFVQTNSAAASRTGALNIAGKVFTITQAAPDTIAPAVTITGPRQGQRVTNATLRVTGTASDNVMVAQVQVNLNNTVWQTATGTTAWQTLMNLQAGPNTVAAYAVDASGNRSTTNTVNVIYVLSGPLVVGINGKGTLNPNYNGKLLEIGKVHSMTATPAVGYAFSNWTDAVGLVITNRTMLSFVMQSNLVFNANFVDIQKPTVTITAPTLNQRWSNAVFTVAGRVSDNGSVAQVLYQLNTGDWTSAATANNWSNWTASMTLTPGPNTVRAYALDAAGNRSTTNTVTMTYVLSGPLVVGITGKGTINPNYNGKLLEIGKVHSMTATPAVGYAFSNWTDAVGTVITNKTTLSFLMQSNLVFNANFVDIQKPTVTITAPTLNHRWSNALFSVAGKAADNGAVAQVFYRLNTDDWTVANTANNWSNWTASVTLTPGPNTVRAYAVDATGNRSTTNTVTMTYVLSGPLVVGITGKGTVTPNYNGQLLEIGKVHSMTAAPATGYAFSNWTDAVGLVITNRTMLSFVMQSNLVFNANFVDIQKPTVTITAPTLNQRWSNAVFTVAGKAADNGSVAQVFCQLNSGDWTSAATANNWSNWTASVTLPPGPNTVRAYAVDASGNLSTTNTVSVIYVLSGPLVVGINGKGTLNPNYNGKLLEIGKVHSMTATPAVGYAFSNWTDAVGLVITNRTVLSFVMQSNLVFNANFVDIQKPTVTITAPTLNQRSSNAVFTVAGKATDNGQVAQVYYQLNTGDWTIASTANAWSNWTGSVTLTPGPNTVRAYAVDATGNRSTTNAVNFTYVVTYPLVEYFHPITVGNQWVYRFTHDFGTPTNSLIRVDSASHPLTCYRGRGVPTPYVTNVISLYSSYCDYHNGAEVNIEDTWYEYYSTNGGVRIWGSDDDPGTVPDPDQERLRVDGGALLGDRLAVGQTITATRDFYEDGEFLGAIPVSVQLVSYGSITVPAGTFPDCLHIRVTHTINGTPTSFEEWLAKGVGMAKKTRTSSSGHPQVYELTEFTIASPVSVPVPVAGEAATPIQLAAPPVADSANQYPLLQLDRDNQGTSLAIGCLRMRLTAPPGRLVVVESSMDLQHWLPIQTNAMIAEGVSLSVPINQFPRQFFRARLP